VIQADNISFQQGNKTLLQPLSMTIPPRTVTAILGPNGAGKSTLLKCLTGLQQVTTGEVRLDDKRLSDYPVDVLSRRRAVLSQAQPLNFPFTALEIVNMGRSPYQAEKMPAQYIDISHQAMAVVDAVHLKNRIFPTLSGGEQQRVQLARVLAQLWEMQNTYLFLDEPTSALDLKHQHQLMAHVQQLARQFDSGVCIVMHDLQLAARYADQVLLLKDGALFAAGDTATMLTKQNIESVFEVPAGLVFSRPIQH